MSSCDITEIFYTYIQLDYLYSSDFDLWVKKDWKINIYYTLLLGET